MERQALVCSGICHGKHPVRVIFSPVAKVFHMFPTARGIHQPGYPLQRLAGRKGGVGLTPAPGLVAVTRP